MRFDFRPPQILGGAAARVDHPVGVAKIGHPIRGQLGPIAPDPSIDPGEKVEDRPGHRYGGDRAPQRAPQRLAELAMSPPAVPAIVRLDQQPFGSLGIGQRQKQSTEIVDMDQRQTAFGRQQDEAALRHAVKFERFLVAGTINRRRPDDAVG